MAVDATEARLAGTGKPAARLPHTVPIGSAHIGQNAKRALLCGVCRHGDGAAVNHWRKKRNISMYKCTIVEAGTARDTYSTQ